MQTFTVKKAEAEVLSQQVLRQSDHDWGMLQEGETHDINDHYDIGVSDDDLINMQNKTRKLNLYRKLRKLNGKSYKKELGADAPLDVVAFTQHTPDTCNCVVEFLWRTDHADDWVDVHPQYESGTIVVHNGKSWKAKSRVVQTEDTHAEPGVSPLWESHHDQAIYRKHHGHRSHRYCGSHEHLRNDLKGHHDDVLAENQHKNHSVHALAEHLGVDPGEIEWRHKKHEGKRKLHLNHPKLEDAEIAKTAGEHLGRHDRAKKRAVRLTRSGH